MRYRREIETRDKLLRVAERLFAERGVDEVTLLEIAQEAGQKNRAAVQYHFGDRRELIECVLERHALPVQQSWIEPLSMLRREGLMTIERLVGLMVSSLVRRALEEEGGAAYVSICRQLLVHPTLSLMETRAVSADGALQMQMALQELAPPPPGLEVLWGIRMANLLFHSIGDYIRFGALTGLEREPFQDDLVRTICAWLRGAAAAS